MGISTFLNFSFFNNEVYGQRDGSNCGKAIELPAPAETCKNDDYHLKEREKWFEFTANDREVEVLLEKSENSPVEEIKLISLHEHRCPNPPKLAESISHNGEYPSLKLRDLVHGRKYIVKIENDRLLEGNFKICLRRDILKCMNFTASISSSAEFLLPGGDPVVLTASNGEIFQWSTGENSKSISVTNSGNYFVTVTNYNNCTASASITIKKLLPCGFDERLNALKAEDPDLEQEIISFERRVTQEVIRKRALRTITKDILIPVVVHVIYDDVNDTKVNISDAQIDAQIEALNRGFSNLDGSVNPVATDTRIRFCLAEKMPDGSTTWASGKSGVVRHLNNYVTNFIFNNSSQEYYLSNNLQPLFPPDNYFNIWVVKQIYQNDDPTKLVTGYSSGRAFNEHDNFDGVIIRADFFLDNTYCPPSCFIPFWTINENGKVLVHETGHYFGLWHTFEGNNCSGEGDFVVDTPPEANMHNTCDITFSCNLLQSDPIENYMDYSPDLCRNTFTIGQNERMRTKVEMIRPILVSAPNLSETGSSCSGSFVLNANFSVDQTQLCINNSYNVATFKAAFNNVSASYNWDFGDGTILPTLVSDVTHTYTTQGIYTVSLTVSYNGNQVTQTDNNLIFATECNLYNPNQSNWYFGNYCELNFANGYPVQGNNAFVNRTINVEEGSASISDENGNLLFYTDGTTVWNAIHEKMFPQTHELISGESTSQPALILQSKTNLSQYYIFIVPTGQSREAPVSKFSYSLVDISKQNGKGELVEINTIIPTPGNVDISENITAIPHCNDKDYFIIVHQFTGVSLDPSNWHFFVFLLNENGLTFIGSFDSQIISTNNAGNLKASPDGKKIIYSQNRGAFLYDFNKSTGEISNPIQLNSYECVGSTFAPGSTLIYISTLQYFSVENQFQSSILQYDISELDPLLTEKVVAILPDGWHNFQLGPDKKIYLSNNLSNYLSVINFPDTKVQNGNECGYNYFGIKLDDIQSNDKYCRLGLPYFVDALPNYNFHAEITQSTNVSCNGLSDGMIEINATGGFSPYTYGWNADPPQTSNLINNLSAGTYTVTITDAKACTVTNETIITENSLFSVSIFTTKIPNCGMSNGNIGVTAQNGIPPYTYSWSTGQNSGQVAYNLSEGSYTITITDATGCNASTSTTIGCNTCNDSNFDINSTIWIENKTSNICTYPDILASPCPGYLFTLGIKIFYDGSISIPSNTIITTEIPSNMDITTVLGPIGSFKGYFSLFDLNGNTIKWIVKESNNLPNKFHIRFLVYVMVNTENTPPLLLDVTTPDGCKFEFTRIWSTACQCAFDPNSKHISPIGCGDEGIITNQKLTYSINFQNIGTGPARNIILDDQIDSNLDINSFELIYSSHQISNFLIDQNLRTLSILFEDIFLPSLLYDPEGSVGEVIYSILPIQHLPNGTKIINKTSIVFDQNEPIFTNQTINTIVDDINIYLDAGSDKIVYLGYLPYECTNLDASATGGLPPYSYQWSTGENSQTIYVCPNQTTKYYVTATYSDGCPVAIDSVTVNVVDVLCGTNNDNVILCHLSKSGKWEKICVDSSSVKTHLDNGDYLGPCNSQARTLKKKVLKVEKENTEYFSITPNPVSSKFSCHLSLPYDSKIKIELYDVTGKRIATILKANLMKDNMISFSYDLTQINENILICRVCTNRKNFNLKLIKSN